MAIAATALVMGATATAPAAVDVDVAPSGSTSLVWSDLWYGGRERAQASDGTFGAVKTPSSDDWVRDIETAVDASGNAVLLWTEGDLTLLTRRRSADGTLGPVHPLTTNHVWDNVPHVALDGQGGAVFVWVGYLDEKTILQGRRQAADGTLSPIRNLGSGYYPMAGPVVAVDSNGTATVAWNRRGPRVVQTRRWRSDGTLGPAVDLSASGIGAKNVHMGLAADGTAVFAWEQNPSSGVGLALHARHRHPSGRLGTPIQLTPAEQPAMARSVDLAVTSAGDAIATWANHYVALQNPSGVRARRLGAGGQLSAVDTLGTQGDPENFMPRVVVDGVGNAVFAWGRGYDSWADDLFTRRRTASGTLGPVAQVNADDMQGAYSWRNRWFDVDVSEAGTATFVWPTSPRGSSATRRRSPTGQLTPITALPLP